MELMGSQTNDIKLKRPAWKYALSALKNRLFDFLFDLLIPL